MTQRKNLFKILGNTIDNDISDDVTNQAIAENKFDRLKQSEEEGDDKKCKVITIEISTLDEVMCACKKEDELKEEKDKIINMLFNVSNELLTAPFI